MPITVSYKDIEEIERAIKEGEKPNLGLILAALAELKRARKLLAKYRGL